MKNFALKKPKLQKEDLKEFSNFYIYGRTKLRPMKEEFEFIFQEVFKDYGVRLDPYAFARLVAFRYITRGPGTSIANFKSWTGDFISSQSIAS
ncbi:hypothetical protein LEP1GSC162_0767 [Leptospira santarosai str. CBC1531]|uniref:hypothetical protein n=1 Tax=Leptospira santarosai TaxID=28183 RepID=UPI0002BFE33A|nr:hypothetical protein [Leptospira santarosai]EMP81956.1 hypothetical protein LEP1GSC162_0767 [Leptospira santarosai str. CBC1531]